MIKTALTALALALLASSTAFAVPTESSATGTITLSGTLAPKAISIQFALKDCGLDTDVAACRGSLNAAVFAGHANSSSVELDNLGTVTRSRFVQFEAKSKVLLFKNDYLQFIAALTSSVNDVTVSLRQLNFVRGGKATFGQTTLGSSPLILAMNESMLGLDTIPLTQTLTAVWDQLNDVPNSANEKVFFATATGDELVVRGVLEITFGDEATSDAYNAVITAGFTAKDN